MAKIGVKHVVGAVLDDSGTVAQYSNGMIIGKAISINLTNTSSDVKLYADDGIAEAFNEFSNGTIALNVDDLTYSVQGMLLGHEATDTTLTARTTDTAPYVGVGFYGTVLRNNVKYYRAVWLYKVKFSEPNDESTTKGDQVQFGTPTINGTYIQLANNIYKDEGLFETEEEAIDFVDGLAVLPKVTTVVISPTSATVAAGATQQFTAVVSGTNNPPQTVTWTIVGAHVSGTAIDNAGLLTIAEDETATTLTVKVAPTFDNSKTATATVTITAA